MIILNIFFKVVVSVFCMLWILKSIAFPLGVYAYYKDAYMALAANCGEAMDSSWYIQQEESESLQKTEKIQMLICHEYDKTRKLMLASGVPEEILSYLGLKALEIHQRTAEEFVEMHRFDYR